MQARRLLLSVLAVSLVCGLVAGPADAATKADKKQNKALKALNKRTKSAGKKLNKVAADLGKVSGDLGNIQAAVPTVISSLTQLGDAAKKLQTGLEAAGAGLTALKDNFTGYVSGAEYGVVALQVGGTIAPGQILVSSDVPDDGNQATVSGRLIAQVPGSQTDVPISLKAAIRSGEKDGTGAANPAAAAGLMAMNVTAIGGAVTGGHPVVGTDAPLTSAPNATLAGAPVYPIADKAPRSDATPNPFAFPDAVSIDLTDPATMFDAGFGAPSKFKVTTPAGPGAVIMVDVTVRFNDLSASATDLNE